MGAQVNPGNIMQCKTSQRQGKKKKLTENLYVASEIKLGCQGKRNRKEKKETGKTTQLQFCKMSMLD